MNECQSTYDVAVWGIRVRRGTRRTVYEVRWRVGARQRTSTHPTRALADSFRAALIGAARRGEAFDVATGRPSSMAVPEPVIEETWFEFACAYADMKWKNSAAKSRAGVAETLAALTTVLVADKKGRPDDTDLRAAMYHWACNPARRRQPPPEKLRAAAEWLRTQSVPARRLNEPRLIRRALDVLGSKLDGSPCAAATFRRKRAVFHNALDFAVEGELLTENPLAKLKHTVPKPAQAIDPRVLIDRRRAEAILEALGSQGATGRHLVAFFGCMYFAALRPAEAAALRRSDVTLPATVDGWGELHLSGSAPAAGRAWTNGGLRRDVRQLKHRAVGEVRVVPCHPRLAEMLRAHLDHFGADHDGRLFRGARGGPLSEGVYGRAWGNARKAALTEAEAASSMALRPYDLRHACVTTWLNATGDPAQVAAWAGHSVNVLLRVYVRCVAGGDEIAKQRIARALQPGESTSPRP